MIKIQIKAWVRDKEGIESFSAPTGASCCSHRSVGTRRTSTDIALAVIRHAAKVQKTGRSIGLWLARFLLLCFLLFYRCCFEQYLT